MAKITSHGADAAAPSDDSNLQLSSTVKVQKRAHNKRSNPHHDHKPSDEMDLLISTINKLDLGWKADVCKL